MEREDPTKMTEEQLKSRAYDCVCQIGIWQNNLKIIETELAKRAQATIGPEKKEKEDVGT